jgi:hypothetical protein
MMSLLIRPPKKYFTLGVGKVKHFLSLQRVLSDKRVDIVRLSSRRDL